MQGNENPAQRAPRRQGLFLLGVLLALAGGIFWWGNRRTPLPPAEGVALQLPAAAPNRALSIPAPGYDSHEIQPADPARLAKGIIRVGTYNIDGGQGTDHKVDLGRTAGVIAGCDLVALQEVHGSFSGNQADELGRLTIMPWLFAPVERRWWHDDFGNGVLCRLPIEHWQRLPLSTEASGSNRNVILLRLPIGGKTLNVLITHLDRGADHAQEIREVTQIFASLAEPCLLLGDLNTPPQDPSIAPLLHVPGVHDVINENLGHTAVDHIDWILTRGLKCTHVSYTPSGPSDHPFYSADVELPGENSGTGEK